MIAPNGIPRVIARIALALFLFEAIGSDYTLGQDPRPPIGEKSEQRIFPTDDWETVSPKESGFNSEKLEKAVSLAMQRKASSLVIVKDGQIIVERHAKIESPSRIYRQTVHGTNSSGHSIEDVASVQKSVASVLLGIALSKDLLELSDPVSKHLGKGWSLATAQQEQKITVEHLVTMTSGLDRQLQFQHSPGTVWSYNTNAYAKVLEVIENASQMNRNEFTRKWLTKPLGMNDSEWVQRKTLRRNADAKYGFCTTARDLARFGVLMLSRGRWREQAIINNDAYLEASISPSQAMNRSYGYLWWLNGQESIIRPSRGKLRQPFISSAPEDLFAAEGALGRKVQIVPSLGLVVVRIGDNPDRAGQSRYDEEFWRLLMDAIK